MSRDNLKRIGNFTWDEVMELVQPIQESFKNLEKRIAQLESTISIQKSKLNGHIRTSHREPW